MTLIYIGVAMIFVPLTGLVVLPWAISRKKKEEK